MSETDGVFKDALAVFSSPPAKKRTREVLNDSLTLTCNFFSNDNSRTLEAELESVKESLALHKKHFQDYRETQQSIESVESKIQAELHRGAMMIKDMELLMPCLVERAFNDCSKKKFEASCSELANIVLNKALGKHEGLEERLDALAVELGNLQVSLKERVSENSQKIEKVDEKIEEFCSLVFENAESQDQADGASDLEMTALKTSSCQTSNLAAMLLNCEELTLRQQELVEASPLAQGVMKRMADRAVLMKAILVPHWWKKEDINRTAESWLHDVVEAGGAKYLYPKMYRDKTLSYTLITTYYGLVDQEFHAWNGANLIVQLQKRAEAMQKQIEVQKQLDQLENEPFFRLRKQTEHAVEMDGEETGCKVFENKDGQHVELCEETQSVKFLKYF